MAALVTRARNLKPGPITDPSSTLGPIVGGDRRELVDRHVRSAVAAGARVLTGGRVIERPGFFYEPTVLDDCLDSMSVMREESFGPVAAVRVVDSFHAALTAADGTHGGGAAVVLSASQEHAQRAWRELRVETVTINNVVSGAVGGSAEPWHHSGIGSTYDPGMLNEVAAAKMVHMEPAVVSENLGTPHELGALNARPGS